MMRRRALAALSTLAWLIPAPPPAMAGPTYVFPVVGDAGFAATHHDYPATDIMAACGRTVVAPTAGVVRQVNRVDRWTRKTDDPATRGGRYVTIVGDDGVRYYLAHLDTVPSSLTAGTRVSAGRAVGTVGRTGRAGACHLHFGISPPCPTSAEWWVRRGVVSPYRYLRAWRSGTSRSPADAVVRWRQAHPRACASPAVIGAS